MTQGLLCPEKSQVPGSCHLPSWLLSQLTLSFVFLLSKPEEGCRRDIPSERKGTSVPNPHNRGSSGSVLVPLFSLEKYGSRAQGMLPHSPSGPGVLPLLVGWRSKHCFWSRLFESVGQHPGPGQKPFLEEVSTFVPTPPEMGFSQPRLLHWNATDWVA